MARADARSEEHERAEESAADLIARTKAGGYDVTMDQLTRWHRRGLLPKPRQVSLGRKGSELRFPAGTSERLLELLRLKNLNRSLAKVGWGLWWGGYEVPDRLAREYITKLIQTNRRLLGQLVTEDGELTEKAHDALDKATGELPTGTVRRARRRVGKEDFEFFMQSLLLVAGGHTDLVKTEDLEMLEHGMAIDHARTDPLVSTGEPWLKGDVRVDFENIVNLNNSIFLLDMLDQSSDAALRQARDQAKAFMSVVINVGTMVQPAGASAFGYGAFAQDFSELSTQPDGQAYLTVGLLAAGRAGYQQGIDQTTSQLDQSEVGVRKHQIFLELRAAVPGLGSVITDHRLGASMKNAAANERLQADIRASRAAWGPEIDAFFAGHPEYCEFLESL